MTDTDKETGETQLEDAIAAVLEREPDADGAADDTVTADDANDVQPSRRKRSRAKSTTPANEDEGETQQQRLHQTARDYVAAVEEIMGDDFQSLVQTPLDWIPGFFWRPDMVPIDPELKALMLALLEVEVPVELVQAPDAMGCPSCNARGMQKTGSLADGNREKPCVRCGGVGWVANVDEKPTDGNVTHLPAPPTTGLPDAFGRPAGHPHWGIPPADIGVG